MAAITNLLATSTSANATTYSTNAFTPAASSIIFAFVAASGTTATNPWLEISTESWRRFTLVTTAQWGGGANRLYGFISNGSVSSASPMKAFFNCAQDAATGAIIQMAQVTGMSRTGLTAIRQIAVVDSDSAASTVPTVTFAVSTLTANACIAGVGYNSSLAGCIPMSGWTEGADLGYTTPSTALECMYRNSGTTSTTVSSGAPISSLNCMMAFELNVSTIDMPMGTNLQCMYIR